MSELWFFFFCGGVGISFVGRCSCGDARHGSSTHTRWTSCAGHNGRSTTRSTTRNKRAARSARCISTISGRRLDSANNRPGLRVHPPTPAAGRRVRVGLGPTG